MGRIQLLSEEVASQVAAGEVVERPASVVKELVENSIDAGASQIEIGLRRGGISAIQVQDNGCGMDRDDALLCLERHATSKIRTGHDLAAISTLGFRGEALPSIASVSRFRLSTRPAAAMAGTEILVQGGRIEHVRDSGEAPGTRIEVRSLFYNLPARRKFLRTENTETSHVEQQLHLQAIGHPHIGFTFVKDDRLAWQLPPVTELGQRIADLSGAGLRAQLLEVPDATYHGLRIRGLIGKAGISRSTRSQQIIFLNGRAIENSTVNYGLREGYHTALMKGQFPVTFLFIDLDPALVDVNVHPAKREVRFRDPGLVREAVVEAIRRALEGSRPEFNRSFQPAAAPAEPPPPELIPPREQPALRQAGSAFLTAPIAPVTPVPVEVPAALDPAPAGEDFRILGVLGRLYILMENASGLVLVDQHAAHERVLFEELRRRLETQGVPTQRLLLPLTLQLGPRDADWITLNLATLQKMGLGLEPFGPGTFKIDALPQFLELGTADPLQLVRDIIDDLRQTSTHSSKLRLGEDIIATTVCRHAVKAHDLLREPELVRLIQDLLRCELPYCCPHGRPTMIQMSYYELEKKFGRKA